MIDHSIPPTHPSIRILNLDIKCITHEELLRQLNQGVLFTPNLDHLVNLQNDRDFYEAYQQAEWVVCDSRILYGLSKILKQPHIPEAIPGSAFLALFYTYHKKNPDCRIFLLGSAEGIAQQAMQQINRKVGRKIVVGAYSPLFGFEKDEVECRNVIDIINGSGATVLVVGVGAPKQEKWIAKYRNNMPKVKLFMALGATIDFEAGVKKRAPLVWQRLGLEWFYRFLNEPRRLFNRYFINDISFFRHFTKQLLNGYRNPFG